MSIYKIFTTEIEIGECNHPQLWRVPGAGCWFFGDAEDAPSDAFYPTQAEKEGLRDLLVDQGTGLHWNLNDVLNHLI